MAANDMTNLANVKSWLGITNSTDDALLTSLITGVSSFIQEYCSRDFVLTTYTNELYNGTGSNLQSLRQYPIVSISSLLIDGALVPASEYTIADRSIFLKSDRVFTRSYGNVSVSYQAGYSTIPAALERATIELIGQRYVEKDRIGFSSKQLAGETVSFVTRDMLASVSSSLSQFMNVVPA